MQRDSTRLRVDEPVQLTLVAGRQPSQPVILEHIPVLQSTKHALDYACQLAGLVPKEIYPHMDCDKSTWSRICSGEWDLDGRDVTRFNKVVGNSAYLLYLAHADEWDLGYMRKRQSAQEREMAELRAENADLKRAFALAFGIRK